MTFDQLTDAYGVHLFPHYLLTLYAELCHPTFLFMSANFYSVPFEPGADEQGRGSCRAAHKNFI